MIRAAIIAATLGAFAGGCTKVPDLDPGNCGNRIVEGNEDCDGFAPAGLRCGEPGTSTQCSFTCVPDDAEPTCPTDWQCGRDGQCRQPTGTFAIESVATLQFATQELAVGDIDGDGYIDIVGNQSSRVTMRLGGTSGILSEQRQVLVPEPIGPLLFDYVDEDPLMDVIVPIAGGLFTMVGDARPSLEPVSYASLQLNPAGGIRTLAVEVFPADNDREILALTNDGMVFFEAKSTASGAYPGGGTFATMGRDVAVGDVDGDGESEVALAFDKQLVVHICRGQVDDEGREESLQAVCRATDTVTTTNPINAAGGTHFADVDGDGFLDLLVSVTVEDGSQQVEVARGDGLGGFGRGEVAALFSDTFDQGGNRLPRADTWPIAIANLDGDGDADGTDAHDYVFSKDIMLVRASGAGGLPERGEVVARAGTDIWTAATIMDSNNDGRDDVAVGLGQLDAIDFFLNNEAPGVGVVFNKFRVATGAPARLLRGGDFDGDLVDDVAFVQGELDDDQPNQVAVSFGNTSGSPSEPISMGNFGKIEVLEPIDTSLGNGNVDTIKDLAVVFSSAAPPSRLANVLRGDSSRRMLSPFFLFTLEETFDVPQGVALGSFGSLPGSLPEARDLVVIGRHMDGFRAWLLAGTGSQGGLTAFGRQAPLPASSELDYACALWRAGDLDGVPGDEVVGIDTRSGCAGSGSAGQSATLLTMKIEAGAFDNSNSAALAPVITDIGPDFVNLRALHLHDMDLDGSLDIVAVFRGDDRAGVGSKAVIFWNDGGAFDVQNDRAVIESPPFVFHDGAPIRFGSAAPELLLLSEGQVNGELRRLIVRATYQGERSYAAPTRLVERGSSGRLAVADLDGDGLEDIVYTDGDNAHVIVQTPAPPLGSRDTVSAPEAAP